MQRGLVMIAVKNVYDLTGKDEVEDFILLCLQKSPAGFELVTAGAGLEGNCLACIARKRINKGKEGDYLDQSKAV